LRRWGYHHKALPAVARNSTDQLAIKLELLVPPDFPVADFAYCNAPEVTLPIA
jgi:hypothetical protein